MLRKLRICLAVIFLAGITLLFCGIGHQHWGWMAKLQFLPSCLALNFATVAAILLLTFLFGRFYCSVICPLGVFQDAVIFLRKKISPKRKSKYRKPNTLVRYLFLALTILCIILGIQVAIALIAPYSAYGRIVRALVSSAAALCGSESTGVVPALIITGLASLLLISICAWLFDRDYCNTICPVGTVLGTVSKVSLFRPQINPDLCKSCGKCERNCKAHCIDSKNKTIDSGRCIDCFDCLSSCSFGALKYSGPHKAAKQESDQSGRRTFIATLGVLGGSAISASAQNMKVDGGLAPVTPKTNPERTERLVPFGAQSVQNFYSKCTACQLCVSACPNGVLRASANIENFLQPVMGYEKGYCRPECTLCSQVCPAGAILPLERGQKLSTHIGVAKVNLKLCLPHSEDVACGNCARHCPVGAIVMVSNPEGGKKIPSVVEDLCIGCGACENLCPSRPISAITVNGLSVHRNG